MRKSSALVWMFHHDLAPLPCLVMFWSVFSHVLRLLFPNISSKHFVCCFFAIEGLCYLQNVPLECISRVKSKKPSLTGLPPIPPCILVAASFCVTVIPE